MAEQHQIALPEPRHARHVVGRKPLRRHRILEGHVEVLLPADERGVRAAERHHQRAVGQQQRHRRELGLVFAAEPLVDRAHVNRRETGVAGHCGEQGLGELRVGQSGVARVVIEILRVQVGGCVGQRGGGEIGLAQRTQRVQRVAQCGLRVGHQGSPSGGGRAVPALPIGQRGHHVRHRLIGERGQH